MSQIKEKTSNFSSPIIEIKLSSKNKSPKKMIKKKRNNSSLKKKKKITIKNGQFTLDEDLKLKEWVKNHGAKNWEACGRFIIGRNGKQCREHWNNCLNPELFKGEWTEEEDFLIMFFYDRCDGSWKKITSLFKGRIENSVKNRFYSQLRKYAFRYMPIKDRKLYSKLKLVELKKYLNIALSEVKSEFLKKSKMTNIEFEAFLAQNELKIEEYENNETNISTNNGDNSEINKNANKEEISFAIKRKRNEKESEDDNINNKSDKNNTLIEKEKFEFSFDDESFDNNIIGLEQNKIMNIFDIFDKNSAFNSNINNSTKNNYDLFSINNVINNDFNEENKSILSMDDFELKFKPKIPYINPINNSNYYESNYIDILSNNNHNDIIIKNDDEIILKPNLNRNIYLV